jgi:asparagine synthase
MTRAVLVVSRDPKAPNSLDSFADVLNRNLAADNIDPRPATVIHRTGVTAAVLNPSTTSRTQGASIAIGTLLDPIGDWHVPGAPLPDGSFALLRADDTHVELVADGVGSRTLWYTVTDRELIASTSQRAIVTLLGSFEPNRDVLPWMLSAGTLGPLDGWDARVKRVQPGERVLLDRSRWRVKSTVEQPSPSPEANLSHDAHRERLRSTVSDACRRWSFDARKWILTLSGGADSRSLLCLLRDRRIGTVTWGLPHSDEKDGNDAQVAREVARIVGAPHRFIAIEAGAVSDPEVVLRRFVALGEGRVDRISGYVDGFGVWKTLFEEGFDGVIRGDHAFGSELVRSAYAVRSKTSLTTLADYFSADEIESFEFPEQRIPEVLTRAPAETGAAWRDRLFRTSRIPTFLAALTDLKTPYVDVGNPLLARSVLDCVRALPDELRTGKRLWRELVRAQLPEVAIARRVAIPSVTDFLKERRVLQLLLDELASDRAASIFAPALRARCREALIGVLHTKRSMRRTDWGETWLGRAVPAHVRAVVGAWRSKRPEMEPLVLAFRVFVASRMQAMLDADAATRPAEHATPARAWGSR